MILFSAIAAPGALAEQPKAAPLTLADALALAERQGFDILLAQAGVVSAQADLAAAGRFPNPLFSGTYTRSTGVPLQNGDTTTAQGYSLTLSDQGTVEGLLSGKRDLRVRQAEAALGSARFNREDALRLLRFQVAQAFYALLSAQASERVAREVAKSFSQAFDLVRTRYRYGAVSEVDLARIETASLEAEQTVTNAAFQVAQAKANLAVLLGAQGPVAVEVTGSLEGEAPRWLVDGGLDRLLKDALAMRPDIRAAREALESAEAALALARRQRLPDVALAGGYAREGPEAAPITPPSVSLGASFELPVFHQRQAEIARAESQRVSAKISFDRAATRGSSDVLTAWAGFQAARELVGRMQGRLLAQARRARELVEYQYRAGAISLIDLLDAERTALAIELEYQQNLGQFRTAAAQLAAAVGHPVMP